MSPEAVGFRSPVTTAQQSSSFGNPYSSENQPVEGLRMAESGMTSFTSQVDSKKSISSAGRLRPRLVKVRRQSSFSQHARSSSVSAKSNSFHNFFPSTSENLCRANSSTDISNGFSDTVNKFAEKLSAGRFVKFDNQGFVFGANNKLQNGGKNEPESEPKKGVVDKNNVVSEFSLEKNGGTFGVDVMRKFENVGVVFQRFVNMAKSEESTSSKPGESSKNVEREESVTKFRNEDNAEFVFGANKNIGRLVPENHREIKLENGGGDLNKFQCGGFAFNTNSNGIRQNSKLRHVASKEYLKSKKLGKSAKNTLDAETESWDNKINDGTFVFGNGINASDGTNLVKNEERAENCNEFTMSQIPNLMSQKSFST